METDEIIIDDINELIKSRIYSVIDLKNYTCKFIKITSDLAFFRKDENLYIFNLKNNKKIILFKLCK